MPRYSDERRQAVVAKLLPPYNQSVEEVARQEGISSATIYKWRQEARSEGRCLPDASDQGAEAWTSRDKFAAVVETAGTHQRWTQHGELKADQRPLAERPTPANALTPEEEADILAQCHRKVFASLPPDQIVVRLMDEEQRYIADTANLDSAIQSIYCISIHVN